VNVKKVKRAFLGVGTTAVGAGLIAAGTWAYWSDQATNNNNTFATGSLHVQLAGDPLGATQQTSPYFQISGAGPGDPPTTKDVYVKNSGTLAEQNAISFVESANDSANGKALFSDLHVKIVAFQTNVAGQEVPNPQGTTIFDGPMSHVSKVLLDANQPAGSVDHYQISVDLPSTVNDPNAENATTTFAIVIDATQTSNSGVYNTNSN
jgi:predicted ribosomally synthesized peptide with SipW-like signal peptide